MGLACVDAAVAKAARSPEAFATCHGAARRVLLRRFPYAVFYMVEGEELVVLAVAHERRQPAYGVNRIRTQ